MMNSNRLSRAPLLMVVLAVGLSSGGTLASGSKTIDAPPRVASTPYYLPSDFIKIFKFGEPAPLGSAQDQSDLRALKTAQDTRTKADCKRAADLALPVSPAYDEFMGAVSPFSKPVTGEARRFIIKIWSDAGLVSDTYKRKYNWPRAYETDSSIEPCLERTSSPGFPSGHAVLSRVFALVLSLIVPEKRDVYLARSDEIGNDRVLAGMHRPSEVRASGLLADQIVAKMLESADFRRDLARVKKLAKHGK